MLEIRQTETYEAWFAQLRDERARAKVIVRIRRLSLGNPGDVKPVGSGVSELRIDYGTGYRVYYVQRSAACAVLLCGGTKDSQAGDIKEAIRLAGELE